jgi:hypothetical protein
VDVSYVRGHWVLIVNYYYVPVGSLFMHILEKNVYQTWQWGRLAVEKEVELGRLTGRTNDQTVKIRLEANNSFWLGDQ